VIGRDIPFNFPTLVNAGVAETDGELVLLLNNDTEVVDGAWLDEMAGYAQRPEIGTVGCVLLYPNGSVQHGGVVLGAGGVAGHSHAGERSHVPGYFGRLLVQSNYAAVTAACLMVRREVFEAVGGFDEHLAVAFNDVDFCLKALRQGYRNVCLGQVRLIHHESASRGSDEAAENRDRAVGEFRLMRERWKAIIDRDPYYNPNLRSAPPTFEPLVG
jgi:GT2 family glycosyltransferase